MPRITGPQMALYDAFEFREPDTVAPRIEPLVLDVEGAKIGFATYAAFTASRRRDVARSAAATTDGCP
ncbi:hypothetical protein [Amycolatopsis silviterrae]|uniref:Uncharacterized protein n=1 Tax=Amycolatopsis silviterrae TaxID=1656914 RepID=A0ABW5HAL1_9PSEU